MFTGKPGRWDQQPVYRGGNTVDWAGALSCPLAAAGSLSLSVSSSIEWSRAPNLAALEGLRRVQAKGQLRTTAYARNVSRFCEHLGVQPRRLLPTPRHVLSSTLQTWERRHSKLQGLRAVLAVVLGFEPEPATATTLLLMWRNWSSKGRDCITQCAGPCGNKDPNVLLPNRVAPHSGFKTH